MERSVNDQTEKAIPQSNVAGNPRRRSKGAERIAEEGVAGAKNIGMFAAESIPGVGEAIAIKRTSDALDEGDYVGAGIEATAGLFGLLPGAGDALGKALRATTSRLRKDAKLNIDNPGFDEVYQETYAETKQKSADAAKKRAIKSGQKDTYAVNLGNEEGVTGYANSITFTPDELKDLPGAMGEEKFRSSGKKLDRLKKSIAEKGYDPKDNNILIHVREDGQPFIIEGNHRLAEALESGRETIKADVRYLRGAEEKAGPLDPRNIFPQQAPVRQGYNPEDPASRVFHLTKKDYDVADVIGSGINADIGFHVGTAAQATARGSTNIKYDKELAEEMVKGERILPLVLKENLKPARIPDVSSFKEPMRWIGDMSVSKSDRQRIKFLLDDQADADLLAKAPKVTVGGDTYFMLPDVMRIGMDEKLWKDIILEAHRAKRIGLDTVTNQADRIEWFNTLKQTANKNGYDSFVYRNEYEGAATENIDELVEQIQRAQRGEIDPNEIDMSSRFSDSYMLLEPSQAKGLFGGMTEGDPRYMKNEGGLMLQKGGAIPMDRQMSMFDEGGLEDDGGTVDPVSGNDVPPGSSKEEVRDDIPAQLSEGEFVFPADVVRYIGLEKLMMLRQQAKMGLKMMDEMGQMGNSEEATIPDDLPFGMMDLIIVDNEDEEEYNDKKEMQEGGVVTPQDSGIFYQQSQFAGQNNTPGVATAAPDAASRQFVQQPQQSATPTVRYEQPKTTFGDFLTPPQGGPQTITIVNKETGEKELITFIPGVTKIKEGFVREEDYVPKDIVPETETTRIETAATETEDTSGDERRRKREEEMFGPGGGRLGFKGQGEGVDLNGKQRNLVFGISFDGVNPLTGGKSILAGLAIDGVIPADIAGDVTVNFKRADIEFSMTGIEYNDIKRTMQEFGSGSSEVRDKLDKYGYEKAMLEKRQKDFMESQAEKIAKEARKSELAKAREIADENRRKAAINAALEKQRREAIAAAERERAYLASVKDYERDDDSDDPGGFTVKDASGQEYRTDSSGTAGAFKGDPVGMEDEYDFNTGGLAGKKKPKPKKKMKRGGLASKK